MVKTSRILKGGRIASTRKDVVKFTSSIKSDKRLFRAVLQVNKAHVIMMMEQKMITWENGIKLLRGLSKLSSLKLKANIEDVHVAIEEAIINNLGSEVGGNLHIAKSRNDQVATAIRIELRSNLLDLMSFLERLQKALIDLASKNIRTIILGYTHLQPAQPITFAHFLLSYVDALERDQQRLREIHKRVDFCPMGAGALATSSFPINRKRVAELLGFNNVLENSIDAVGNRDFILETLAALSIISVNISRFSEDMIIWSSPNFGLIDLPDTFSSTSSIMPQKKNPEVPEIIRARAGIILGNLVSSTSIMKALPSSYNLDLQEITPKLWESLDSTISSLDILSKLIPQLKINKTDFNKTHLNFVTATELANLLVRRYKVPFRTAYKIIGNLVSTLIDSKLTMNEAKPDLIQKIAKNLTGLTLDIDEKDLERITDIEKLVGSYNVQGGPAPVEVKRMIKTRKKKMNKFSINLKQEKDNLKQIESKLTELSITLGSKV